MTTEDRTRPAHTLWCENCGASPLQEYPTSNSVMWYCPACGLYQKGRGGQADAYNLSYHAGYCSHSRRKLWTATIRLGRIARLVTATTPKLVDIGCSLGYTVEAASRFGWDAQGVDINPEVVRFCRDRGLRCRLVPCVGLPYPAGYFDVVTAWHVVEHVTDVSQTLAEWARVLVPGGILALETPDSSCIKVRLRGKTYRTFWAPEHVYAFNRQNLVQLITSHGFDVVRPPTFAVLPRQDAAFAAYMAGYRLSKRFLEVIRLHKAFQLFCRRRNEAAATFPVRRAA